ncbi:MAG: hypothetical protein OXN83_00200 [Oligoflexia bacterium]|nr:hypothetical protein [Oligoflexia bacterium]
MKLLILFSLIINFVSCIVFNKRVSTVKTDSIKNKVVPTNTKFFVSGEKDCESGLYQLGESPFAVHVFCGDVLRGLGGYIAIVYRSNEIGVPFEKAWSLNDRYWSGKWSSNVKWLQFDSQTDTLLVGTHSIYGSGVPYYSYLLNLYHRKILKRECPKGEECFVEYIEQSEKQKIKAERSPMCKIDLNGDKADDFIFLVYGWKVFVLLTKNGAYNLYLVDEIEKLSRWGQLFCREGNYVTETTAGDGSGRKFKVPTGAYLEIVEPESSSVVYYWKGNGFQEVWTSD